MVVLVKQGQRIAADFRPLIDLLAEVQAANYATAEEQLEHLRQHMAELENAPHPLEWAPVAYAAGTAANIVDFVPGRLSRFENISPAGEL